MRAKTLFLIIPFLILSCLTPEISSDSLTINPEILTGTLDNGLTYFIQNNKKPENRIELRLVVDVGSIQEEEDQRGLAHFVEHMAFNGTKNFPKDKLVKYLESLGMGFGPEINAYTSFDETVYKLSIPADDPEILNSALLILEDWAHSISFEDEEIEKERGVIVEEWRGGRGVYGRYRDVLFPTLLKDSLYGSRLPIGDMHVVKNCDPQRLRDYYKKWYKPDLMALVVVGDIDAKAIEEKVKNSFNFTTTSNAVRESITVPTLDRVDVEIIEDPEMTTSNIALYIKERVLTVDSATNYQEYIKQFLISIMFNGRMEEIYTKPDSPFLSAGAGYGGFIRSSGLLSFSLGVEDGKALSGFEALLVEIEKIKQNGFTTVELDRAKSQVEMIMNNVYNERENRLSTSIVNEIVDYYLKGNVPMSIEDEVTLLSSILKDIPIEGINEYALRSFSGLDRTLSVHIPTNKTSNKLVKDDFKELFTTVPTRTFVQRDEEVIDRSLFNRELQEGEILSEIFDEHTGITTLKLDNGAVVVLKPTDFKADEIKFSAMSFGGLSLVEDRDFRSGELASSLALASGLNGFNAIELDRLLTGKNVNVSPWIENYSEGFSGSSNISDREVMFQLINLYFTDPNFSEESFEVLLKNIESSVLNRENSPKAIFFDRVSELLARGHFRSKPLTVKDLKGINFETAKRIYEERFQDPGDFFYLFTGSFTVDEMLPLIKKYIGSIPTKNIKEEAKDLGLKFPEGVVEDTVIKGIEDQSVVEIIFNGEFAGPKLDEFGLQMLAKYLEEGLRVRIRENMSGTYGVSVFSNIRHYPLKKYAFGIYFGCEPGREEELIEAVFNEIQKLKSGEMKLEVVDSVKNNYIRSMELNIKNNGYWHNSIMTTLILNREYKDIIDTDVSKITSDYLNSLAKEYIDEKRYVRVILVPESTK